MGLKKNDATKFDDHLKYYYEKYDFGQRLCCCKKKSKNLKDHPTKIQVMEDVENKELWHGACENI